MKKFGFSLIVFFFSVLNSRAQDILTNYKGDTLSVKVMEVNESVIKYKKINFLDGPMFVIQKEEIFMIQYFNGNIEYPNQAANAKAEKQIEEHELKIEHRGNRFYQDGYLLSRKGLEEIIGASGNNRAMMELKLAKMTDRRKKIMIITGFPFAIIGAVNIIWTSYLLGNFRMNLYPKDIVFLENSRTFGIISTIGGAVALFYGFSSINSAHNHRLQAVNIYNKGLGSNR